MAGGLFNRLKIWTFEEVLKNADLNAEFDNLINHLSPQFIASFSQTLAQMQLELNPGGLGTEIPAQSTAQEIEQIRFVIARILGNGLLWYQSAPLSLSDINTILAQAVGFPMNRIVSGRHTAQSNQALFLQADGTVATIRVKAGGSNPPLNVFIEGTPYTFSSDIAFSGLSLAPSSGNTATVNDATIVNDKYAGEVDYTIPQITLSGAGAAITALTGSFAAFSFTDGGNTEYLFGFVKSPTQITNCKRGLFFTNLDVPKTRVGLNNGDTITLLKLTWVFVTTTGTIQVVYTNPVWGTSAPASPATGDYWFNIETQKWNTFNGSMFVDAGAILIGICVQDTTKCIASRSFEFFQIYSQLNEINLQDYSSTQISSTQAGQKISSAGALIDYGDSFLIWSTPGNLVTGLTFTANTTYYFYVSGLGELFIDVERPYDRTPDLLGLYHPYQTWRAVGAARSSQVDTFSVNTLVGSHNYQFTVNGNVVSYTSTGGDTQQSILAQLASQIQNATGGDATGGATAVVTGTGAGALLTITSNGTALVYTAIDGDLTHASLPTAFTIVNVVQAGQISGLLLEDASTPKGKLALPAVSSTLAPLGGILISTSSGTFAMTSTTSTPVTGLSGSIRCSGRPVEVRLSGDSGIAYIQVNGSNTTNQAVVEFYRDGLIIASHLHNVGTVASGNTSTIPSSAFYFLDTGASPGVHAYSVNVRVGVAGTTNCLVFATVLVVREVF